MIKVEVIQLIVKEIQLPKICIIHTLHYKENPILTPHCLIHNPLNTPHSPQVSNSSFNFCQGPHCMQQTRFCGKISLVMLSHHPNNAFSLEQPCAASSTPWTNRVFQCSFSTFYLYFCGVGCLSQGKEGQKEKNLK